MNGNTNRSSIIIFPLVLGSDDNVICRSNDQEPKNKHSTHISIIYNNFFDIDDKHNNAEQKWKDGNEKV